MKWQANKIWSSKIHLGSIYALTEINQNEFVSAGGDGIILKWNLEKQEPPKALQKISGQIFTMKTRNEYELVVGDMNGGIHLIDLQNGILKKSIQSNAGSVFDFLIHDGILFSAHKSGKVICWNNALEPIHVISASSNSLRALALNDDRNMCLICGSEGSVFGFDLKNFEMKFSVLVSKMSLFSIAMLNGPQFLTAGRDAKLYEVKNNRVKEICIAHLNTINQILIPQDTEWFATAGRDRELKIWSKDDLSLLKVINAMRDGGHTASVNRLLFMPAHQSLISAGDDKTVIVWKISPS